MDNLNSTLAQKLGLNVSEGVLGDVVHGGPAEKAGLRNPVLQFDNATQLIKGSSSNVILKVDNIPIRNTRDVNSAIQTKKIGDNLTLDILRDDQIKKVTVFPEPKPDYFVFSDPEGLYTVRYPANWINVQKEFYERLVQKSGTVQQFVLPEDLKNRPASFLRPNGSETSTGIMVAKVSSTVPKSDEDLKSVTEDAFAANIIMRNGTVVQDIECERYRIDGNRACSFVISTRDDPSKILQVLTAVGERGFIFEYKAIPESFDEDLPVFEKMLQSFNRTNTTTQTSS
jgi:hypothetical protein